MPVEGTDVTLPLTLALACFLQAAAPQTPAAPVTSTTPTPAVAATTPPKPDTTPAELKARLLHVRRIYVDSFGDDSISKELQSALITALTNTGRFIVTENKDKADAILRGAGLEKTSQELHSHSEGTAVGTGGGGFNANVSGGTGSASGGWIAHTAATEDSNTSTETINDARAAVRLVDPDGDVIWTTTQESKNSKYTSSTADVADRIVKQLLRDIEKLEKPPGSN